MPDVIVNSVASSKVILKSCGSKAAEVSFVATVQVPRNNVQDAIEFLGLSIASGVTVYSLAYVSTTSIVATHNLGRFPLVQVVDNAGYQVEATVRHLNTNQFMVSFNSPESGTLVYV